MLRCTGIVSVLFQKRNGFFQYLYGSISRQGILWKPWKKTLPLSDILSMRTGDCGTLMFILISRHLAFGLLMVTLALYLFMDWLEAGTAHEEKGILWIKNRIFSKEGWKSRNLDQALLMGMFLGLCAFWNGAAVIGGLLILCGFAIFLGWKSGLRCHGGGIHLLFLSSVKDFYCWKCYEPSDLSGISGRG